MSERQRWGLGYKGGKRDHCSDCKADDMINLKGYICSIKDCTNRAFYGYKKEIKFVLFERGT
jgi:hypothetical protein